MKKVLLSCALLGLSLFNAQITNVYSWSFDAAFGADWVTTNQSSPSTTTLWSKAAYTSTSTTPNQIFSSGVGGIPVGQAGGNNSFALVNYSSTTGAGDISNWLIVPAINVKDGDTVSFYTRKGTDGTTDYPDRVELRYSTTTATTIPTGGSTSVGSFTNVGVTVNPNLAAGFVYPKVWTKYSFTVSGVGTTPVPVRFAFRYFVIDGGPSGSNSDIIGIDTFSVDRGTLGTGEEVAAQKSSISVFPNPTTDVLNIKSVAKIDKITIADASGKNVNVKFDDSRVNVSHLTSGAYLINIHTKDGVTTQKFIKK